MVGDKRGGILTKEGEHTELRKRYVTDTFSAEGFMNGGGNPLLREPASDELRLSVVRTTGPLDTSGGDDGLSLAKVEVAGVFKSSEHSRTRALNGVEGRAQHDDWARVILPLTARLIGIRVEKLKRLALQQRRDLAVAHSGPPVGSRLGG